MYQAIRSRTHQQDDDSIENILSVLADVRRGEPENTSQKELIERLLKSLNFDGVHSDDDNAERKRAVDEQELLEKLCKAFESTAGKGVETSNNTKFGLQSFDSFVEYLLDKLQLQ